MTDSTAETTLENRPEPKSRWDWVYRLFIQPKRVFGAIAEIEGRAWIKPMLILTVLVVLLSLLGGPARQREAQMNMGQPPEDFQYWTEERQNQFFEGQAAMQGSLFIYVFPLLGALVGLWAGWFLLGSVIHLLMTFKGSRQPQVAYLNLVAWAALPFALRSLVQLVAVVSTRQVISDPGLSGFISADENGTLSYLGILLSFVDAYSIGFLVLLFIGAPLVSRLNPDKSLGMTALAAVIFIILASLPGLVANKLGGLGTIRPFLFF